MLVSLAVVAHPCPFRDHAGAKIVDVPVAAWRYVQVMIQGIDANSVEALAWKANRLEFKDAKTGETKEYIGKLRASTEPNTVKFAIHA